jgi:hypothetical protein
MARIRYLKPEFFSDEDLAELPFQTRLTFAGLWCLADKAGRLEDRPKFLKAMIFPYDDGIDMEQELEVLARPKRNGKPFIVRYRVQSTKIIQIFSWEKHQKPHHSERASQLPEIPQNIKEQILAVKEPLKERELTGRNGNGDGDGDGKGDGEMEADGINISPLPSEETNLYSVDSTNLTANIKPEPEALAYAQMVLAWNDICGNKDLPKVIQLTEKRKKHMRARLKERPLKDWISIFKKVAATPFLTGQNDRGWKADFDWVMNPDNVAKILEGKYDCNRSKGGGGSGGAAMGLQTIKKIMEERGMAQNQGTEGEKQNGQQNILSGNGEGDVEF